MGLTAGGVPERALLVPSLPCQRRRFASLLLAIAILSGCIVRGVEPATECSSNFDCPGGSCCTGTYSSPGTCSSAPFVSGKQVCPDCNAFANQGLACPASASTCCSDGTCQTSVAGCSCSADSDCPQGTCCTGSYATPGHCSLPFVGGKQACPDCNAFSNQELACPASASTCCSDGTCQTSVAGCKCSADSDCPEGTCCTGSYARPGHCSLPFVGGKQACPDCNVFSAQQLACPASASTCCSDGTCQTSVAGCSCSADSDCPQGTCCTGSYARPKNCSLPFVGGKQVCPDCNAFSNQELACPASASTCCSDGTCQTSVAGCKCSANSDCPEGTCCTGSYARPGHCSLPFVGGKQACPDCNAFSNQELTCPATASTCCSDGTCQTSVAGCSCSADSDCPQGTCCTGSYSRPGNCSLPFVGGKQACPDCNVFSNQELTCPATASTCCSDGTCQMSVAGCKCSADSDCPKGTCCTGSYARPGNCSPPIVSGKQVCPDCSTFADQGLACPSSASTCCSDGTCQTSVAGCSCKGDNECPKGTCCTGSYATPGHCSAPFASGKQACPDCNAFADQGAACPVTASTCCGDGTCQKSVAGCKCSDSSDCPQGACCAGNSTVRGVCSSSVIVGGRQVCEDCRTLTDQRLACPRNLPYCCADGACAASASKCPCTYDPSCPGGICCADRAPPPPHSPPPPPFGPHTTGLVPPAAFKELKFYNSNFRYASYRYVGSATRLNWDLTASVDWRVPYKVTGVKSQGTCGACWAFATVAAIEAAHAIATGGLLSLSEQQVLDCQGRDKCAGGWPSDALEYAANTTKPSGGLALDSTYKYAGSARACSAAQAKQGRAGVAMWEEVNFIGWFGLLLAVQNQPLVVSVAASSPSFVSYVKGVYDNPECFAEGLVDHTLLLVGYVLFADTPYWILKNSWGPRWGEGGFMRLAMHGGEGACGINTQAAFYPVVPSSPKSLCKPNPCGGGTCQVAKGGRSNQCKCPPFFIPHVNIDGSQSCAPSKVCRFFLFNPCGIGTCVDDGRGGYSCICRRGFVAGFRTNGNPTCVPSTLTTGASKYVVQEGDTCYLIYVAFSLTFAQFLAQNPGVDCLALQPQKVVIVTPPRDAPNCILSYAVNDGDTCAKIEATFGIKSVLAINSGLDCTKLVAGLQICVATSTKPAAPDIPTCGAFYTVQPGDTCQSIWTAKKLTQRAFFTLNPGLYCGNLQQFVESRSLPGEQVCVAVASATGTFVCPARSKKYKVRRGDTCQSIAFHQCKRNMHILRSLNRNLVCQTGRLYVGKFLCVPS